MCVCERRTGGTVDRDAVREGESVRVRGFLRARDVRSHLFGAAELFGVGEGAGGTRDARPQAGRGLRAQSGHW